MPVYVGIDQALRKIGVCVLAGDEVVMMEVLRPPRTLRGPERLTFLDAALTDLLQPYAGKITRSAMEKQSLGSIGDIDGLGQINGVVQVALSKLGCPPLLVPPATLKKFVTGKGQATKAQMRRATVRFWGIDIEQDDICDAHGLVQFAREACEHLSTVRHQVEAVDSLSRKKQRPRVKKVLPKTL